MAVKLVDGNHGSTETNVGKLVPPISGKRHVFCIHRSSPRGFGVRIYACGKATPNNPNPEPKRTFIFRYGMEGRQRWVTIGEHGPWSLESARKKAEEIRREIDNDVDYAELKIDSRQAPRVSDRVEEYLQTHVRCLSSGKDVERYFKNDIIPNLGNIKFQNVKKSDLRIMVKAKAENHPNAALKLLSHLKQFFDWAESEELVEFNPAASLKARKLNKNMRIEKRRRVLFAHEIRALWNNIDLQPISKLTAIAVKLILLTGQRPGEVARMRWKDIEGDIWTVPEIHRKKSETSNKIPIPPSAVALLKGATRELERLSKRRHWPESPYVFHTQIHGHLGVNAIDRAMARFRNELGNINDSEFGHWRPHDLRRTCKTRLSELRVEPWISEMILGHKQPGIIDTYDQYDHLPAKRDGLLRWDNYLQEIAREE